MKARAAGLVGDALSEWLSRGVRVDVHQSGNHQPLTAVHVHVDGSFVAPANVDNGIAGEHHIRIAQVSVALIRLIPGDDPGGVADDGGALLHCLIACLRAGILQMAQDVIVDQLRLLPHGEAAGARYQHPLRPR